MRNILKNNFVWMVIGIALCGGTVIASNYMASDISYTPKNSNWKVTNVAEAIDDLMTEHNAVVNYSSEEQIIGTWVNGKPLYQKTYTGAAAQTLPASRASMSFYTFDDNIDEIVNYTGKVSRYKASDNSFVDYLALSFCDYSNSSFYYNVNVTRKSIFVFGQMSNRFFKISPTVTIQYTKTTDQAIDS